MVKPKQAIGIFDSGLGGLSLLPALKQYLPNESLCYLADNAFVPYGTKSTEVIQQRCFDIVDFFIRQDCKAIVIACNTATAVAVDALRNRYQMPIVAMEPAVKPAATLSKQGKVAVCATENTLKHPRFELLVAKYAQNVEVITLACHGWVELVESLEIDSLHAHQVIEQDLTQLLNKDIDALVLGCTHFPLLKTTIAQHLPKSCQILDPSEAVVLELKRQLTEHQQLNTSASIATKDTAFYTAKLADYPDKLSFFYPDFSQIQHINL